MAGGESGESEGRRTMKGAWEGETGDEQREGEGGKQGTSPQLRDKEQDCKKTWDTPCDT